MSTATTTPQSDTGAPGTAEASGTSRTPGVTGADGKHSRRFGLPVATALVMGDIIGGGILLLPASVAPHGTVGLVAFGFSLWLVTGSGYAAVYQGALFLFAGVLVYAGMSARRRRAAAEEAATSS